MTDGRRISTQEAANFIGVSRRTLEAWRIRGGGPAFHKVGSRVVYSRGDVDDYLADRRRTSTSDSGVSDAG